MFVAIYHPRVPSDDFSKINDNDLDKIRLAIEAKLMSKPGLYGERLRGELREYWKLRVGRHRVVYEIRNSTVYVLAIGDRKNIYEMATRRV